MRSMRLVALLAIPAQIVVAQQAPQRGAPLSLEQAIATAQQNNPQFLQTKNTLRTADAQVRSAYGQLMPQASARFGTNYQQGGTQIFQGLQFEGSDSYNSSYSIGLNYNVTSAVRYAPRAAKAQRAAVEANITTAAEVVRSTVTQQYIAAIQAQARADVDDSLIVTAQGQLNLVNAKLEVGAGTIIDVRQAEVALGNAQVTALQDHNTARVAKLQLFQTMGVPADIDARLTTTFAVAMPTFSLDSLLNLAHRVNPDLLAKKSLQTAAELNVGVAKSSYLPSLNLSTGYGANAFGYANTDAQIAQASAGAASSFRSCSTLDSIRVGSGLQALGCKPPTLSQTQIESIRSSNHPFQFNKAPFGVSASLNFPIFNGFAREANVEQARVQRDNAAFDVRARNLQVTTDVTRAYLDLQTAAKTAELQSQIAKKAAEDLALNEASFRVGAKTFLDVTTARAQYEKAQIDQVNATYQYHWAFAALENAVGRPLR